MADSINTISPAPAGLAARTASTTAPSPKAQPEASAAVVDIRHVSPSLRFDPIAGIVITEYFDSSGEIQAQLPSAASVAYLRVGLSPNGSPREQETPAGNAGQAPKDVLA